MHGIPIKVTSSRDQFAQLLRQLLDRAGLSQAMLARRLRQRGIAQVTEPRVSDWTHGRYVPRDEAVVFAIESIFEEAGVAIGEGDLVTRYWAARREPKQPSVAAHRQAALPADTDLGVPQADIQALRVTGAGQAESRPMAVSTFSLSPLGSLRGRSISNLPHRNLNFTGRDNEMMALENYLSDEQRVEAMSVHGLGGVGKTQLILEYAHRHIAHYDIVWWVTADEPATVPGQLATLAHRVGLPEQVEQAEIVTILLDELRNSNRWLLIFDNAEDPRDLHPYWPSGGGGHVLVSSRNPAWRGIAGTVCLDVLSREEGVAFLRRRLDRDDPSFAAMAEAVGDLPLALEQAAAYLEETDIDAAEYLELLGERVDELLALGRPTTTEQTVATTWTLSLKRLREQAPAAEDLLNLSAFLGADDIPRALFVEYADQLPERLATAMTDPLAAAQAIGVLRRFALITTSSDAINLHRLVQAVVRCQLDPIQELHWTANALRLIRGAFPPERTEHEDQAARVYARLLPHALAVTSHGERLGIDPESTVWLLNETGSYLWQQAAHEQALIALERARAIAETGLGQDHPITARSLNLLGCVLGDQGHLTRARTMHEQALAIRERLGPDCIDLPESLNNLACVVEDLGDLNQARSLQKRALAIAEQRLGPNHKDTAIVIHNLAYSLRRDGELRDARSLGERALAIVETSRGPDHPYTATVLINLANILADQGELDTARSMCQRALTIYETRPGPNHPDTAHCLSNLARVLCDQGDFNGARTMLERALDIRETRLGPNHPLTAATVGDLGTLLARQAELDTACSLLERALAIREATLGHDHPDTIKSRQSLATAVMKRSKTP